MAVTIGFGGGGVFVGAGLTVTANTTLTSGLNYLTIRSNYNWVWSYSDCK